MKGYTKLLQCAPLLGLLLLGGCDRHMGWSPVDMWNRARYKPLEPEPFFADGSSSRQLPPGTIARGQFDETDAHGNAIIDERLLQGRKPGTKVISDYVVGNGVREAGNGNMISADTLTTSTTPIVQRSVGDNGLGTDKTLATQFPFPITQQVLNRGHERFNIYCSPCHGRTGEANGMIVQRGFPQPPSFHNQRLINAPVGHFFDVITHGYGAMYSYAERVEPRDRWAIIAYIRLLQKSAAGKPGVYRGDTPRSTLDLPPRVNPGVVPTGAIIKPVVNASKGVNPQ